MKTVKFALLLILTLGFVSCEKEDTDEMLMEQYYEQSMNLSTLTQTEVQAFGNKYEVFISEKPDLIENTYFKPTWRNILKAGYVPVTLSFTIDGEWDGKMEY